MSTKHDHSLKELNKEIWSYFLKEEFVNVKNLCHKLLQLAEVENNDVFKAESFGILGYMEYELGNYEYAIEIIVKALSIFHDGNRKFIDNGHLAMCYSKLNELEKANYYVDLAIKASEELDHNGAKYEWYNFKGNILFKMNDLDNAFKWIERSISVIPKLMNKKDNSFFLYQPYLTKFEILNSIKRIYDKEFLRLKEKLLKFFENIDKPVLHFKRDKKKFYKLIKN